MLAGVNAFIGVLGAFTPVAPPNLAYSTYRPGPTVAYSGVDNNGAQGPGLGTLICVRHLEVPRPSY